MVIIYAGDLDPAGTCFHRMRALQKLGHEVHPVQIFPSNSRSAVSKFRHRMSIGPGIRKLNDSLRAAVRLYSADVLWVDKGIFVRPKTVRDAIQHTRAVVHYNPDDPFGHHQWGWRLFLRGIANYDLHFVARDANVPEYLRAGASRALRFMWAFDPSTHRPISITDELRNKYGAPVGFVGAYEKERARTLYALAMAGVPVRIWGNGWERSPFKHPNLRIEYRGLDNDLYSTAICALDINLCFLRKVNRDQSTTRSIEIPACGAFMLGERTAEHERLFEDGRDAAFFSDDEECVRKVRHYLNHPEERKTIAASGRVRCLESGYDNESRLSYLLKQVELIARPTRSRSIGVPGGRQSILYIGDLSFGGTCRMRAATLKAMGHEIIEVNVLPFAFPMIDSGFLIRAAMRFHPKLFQGVYELNQRVLKVIRERDPDIVWVDKGTLITRQTIQQAKQFSSATWVHYNPDDPFGKFRSHWSIFLESLPLYDVHFVPRPQNLVEYLARGALRVFEFDRSFNPSIHRPRQLDEEDKRRYGSSVGFVGTWASAREGSIASLITNGVDVSIIGDGWVGKRHWQTIKKDYRGSSVYEEEYAKAICGLEIALHFVRHENRDQQDSRTFEIPACGVFMLAERTKRHLELFEEDKEAVFFSTNAELLQKIQFYLAHPLERQTIAAAGRQRCLRSNYDYQSRLSQMLETTFQTRKSNKNSEPV